MDEILNPGSIPYYLLDFEIQGGENVAYFPWPQCKDNNFYLAFTFWESHDKIEGKCMPKCKEVFNNW